MDSSRFPVRIGVPYLRRGALSAFLAVGCWAGAALGQDLDVQTLLTLRGAPGVARTEAPKPQAQSAPVIYLIGNAASFVEPFTSGQLVSIFGPGVGPTPGVGATVTNGVVTNSAGGVQVTFDGTAAPILYAGANQINTVIPCGVAGHASTTVVVNYSGSSSAPVTIPLANAAPGIFTIPSGGSGEGAILNQDFSVNGPNNPAARGSTVAVYATGLGQTSPACTDGEIYNSGLPMPVLAVTATVGGMAAQIQYAGQAPGIISGVAQINVIIPTNAPTGSAIPITVLSGGASSQSKVTVAIK